MSDDRPRLKRPTAARTAPIRQFTAAVGLPPGDNGAPTDAATRAVELGYRVVDEYIRQGQKAARRFGERGAAPAAGGDELQEIATRMMQFTTEWMGLWGELAQRLTGGALGAATAASPAAPPPAWPPAPAPAAATDGGHARVRLEVFAAGPVEVTLDLRPDAVGRPLIVHALRAIDASLPRLEGCEFTPATADAPARLRLTVPAGHPAGAYSGVVVEAASNHPAGTVSVRIP